MCGQTSYASNDSSDDMYIQTRTQTNEELLCRCVDVESHQVCMVYGADVLIDADRVGQLTLQCSYVVDS